MAAALLSSHADMLGWVEPVHVGSTPVDATGGTLLVVMLYTINNPTPALEVAYAGMPLTRLPALDLADVNGVTSVWIKEYPASGTNPLIVLDRASAGGWVSVTAHVLSGVSSAITAAGVTEEATVHHNEIATAAGSILLGGLFQIYRDPTYSATAAGWTRGARHSSEFFVANAFDRAGGGTANFDVTFPGPVHLHSLLLAVPAGSIPAPIPPPATKPIEITSAKVIVTNGRDYSGNTASLDFDFMSPGTLPPSTTFFRGSPTDYVDENGDTQTAGINIPAWTYDDAGNLRGILNSAADPGSGRAKDLITLQITSSRYIIEITRESGVTSTYDPLNDVWYYYEVPQDPSPLQKVRFLPPASPPAGAGIGGTLEARDPWDAAGADLAIFVVTYGNKGRAPRITYGDVDLRPIVPDLFNDYSVPDDENPGKTIFVSRSIVYGLPSPPAGEQILRIWDAQRFSGQVTVQCIGLKGSSGIMGARMAPVQFAQSQSHYFTYCTPGSQMFAVITSFHARPDGIAAAAPWSELDHDEGVYQEGWIWTAPAEGIMPLTLSRTTPKFGHMPIVAFEIFPALDATPDVTVSADQTMAPVTHGPIPATAWLPVADGQKYVLYYEVWSDTPRNWRDVNVTSPRSIHDLGLVKIPPYVNRVLIHTTWPQYTYQGLDDDLYLTTGLSWQMTARDFRDAIALLKQRVPGIEVMITIMQMVVKGGGLGYCENRWPYNPLGFGGMTQDHWDSIKRFVDDMGLDGVDIDYEATPDDPAPEYHCWTDEDGYRRCYTDAEIVAVFRKFRQTFPREDGYLITYPAYSTGCFGEGPFKEAQPSGYNGGSHLCLMKEPDLVDAFDGIHGMTYDAGIAYDPVDSLRSYLWAFPNTPSFLGIRTGPPEWGATPAEQPRRTLADFRDYINKVIILGAAGVHQYAMWWDRAEPSADRYAPNGVYDDEYPDAVMASALIAARFGLGYANVPLLDRATSWPWSSALSLVWCVEIHRRDGTLYRFALRDKSLVFEGETYLAAGGVQASDQVAEDAGEAGSVEALGYMTSSLITDDDIRAGLYDGARITTFMVDWAGEMAGQDLFGRIGESRYLLRRMTRNDDGTWRGEMVDELDLLNREVGRYATRQCPWSLGDDRCKVALAPYTAAVEVTVIADPRRQFRVSAGASSTDGYYVAGTCKILSGLNQGLTVEVTAYDGAARLVSLSIPLPHDLAIGDDVELVRGCDGSWLACKAFGNTDNFGGFPAMPGTGAMIEVART